MKKILGIVVLLFFWIDPAFAYNYLLELGLGGSSSFGGLIIILLILYGAFFGTRVVKSVIWGWIMFFVTFGYVLWFLQPGGFLEAMIALGAGLAVLIFFIFLGENKKNEFEEGSALWNQINKTKKKKKKKKK
ncbi:hypothetical protein N9C51_02995 [Candidatus Pelagibacter sp.]|nr:hypothetical protein [Candidatus Pelagibacter sp.]